MPNHCVVCGRMKGPGMDEISLYRIPKDDDRRKKWLEGLRLTEDDVRAGSRVCSLHFPDGKATNTPSATLGAREPEASAQTRKRRSQTASLVSPPKRQQNCQRESPTLSRDDSGSVVKSVDPTKSYVTATGATVFEQAQFTLHTRDRDGKGKLCNTADVTVKLVRYADNTLVDCTIKEVCEDKCIFQYQPMSAGTHDLYVMIKEEEIIGTPHTIVVYGPKPVRVIDGLDEPWGVTFDSKGRIIVAEGGANCVSIFTPEGDKVKSIGGQSSLRDVTVDECDNIYVLTINGVKRFTPNGEVILEPTNDNSHPLNFGCPNSMAFNPCNKKLYISEYEPCRVQVLNTNLSFSRTFSGKGDGIEQFRCPYGISCDEDGTVYVADHNNHCIKVFSPCGKYLRQFEYLGGPLEITVHHNRVWVTGHVGVKVYTSSGQYIGCPFRDQQYCGIAVDNRGTVIAACGYDDKVYLFQLTNFN